jgi:hypothetical protein
MSLAAWMRAKGKRILSISKVPERRREFRFVFTDEETECPGMALDFLNSDAHDFDTALRALKKMCFGPGGVRSAVARNGR